MTTTLQHTTILTVLECGGCHIPFAMPEDMYRRALESGESFYCPNGHGRHFTQTENMKLKEQLEQKDRQLRYARSSESAARDQARAAERSKAAVKGHLTRMRNKIANGICPVAGCRRHFDNVQAHIQGQHSEWLEQHDITLAQL